MADHLRREAVALERQRFHENRPQTAIYGRRQWRQVSVRLTAPWAVLEANAGSCLGVLLRGDPLASIAMLSKVQTATAKAQAIRVVGAATLGAKDVKELKVLLSRYEALAKRRNDVVHGMWGTTPEWPEHLVWAPPEVISTTSIAIFEMQVTGKVDQFLEEQKAKFVVWSAVRFDELFSEIRSLIKDFVAFTAKENMANLIRKYGDQITVI